MKKKKNLYERLQKTLTKKKKIKKLKRIKIKQKIRELQIKEPVDILGIRRRNK